jgi:hypothetical protein
MPKNALPVIAAYRFKPDVGDAEIHDLLRRHRAALVRGRFTSAREPFVLRSLAERNLIVEVFDWNTEDDARRANADPLVRTVWDEFAARCETVGVRLKDLPEADRPFAHFEAFPMNYGTAPKKRAATAAKRPAAAKAAKKPARKPKKTSPPARAARRGRR